MEGKIKILGIIFVLILSACNTHKQSVETLLKESKDSTSLKEEVNVGKEKDIWVKDTTRYEGSFTIDTYVPDGDSLKLTERKEITFGTSKTTETGKRETEKSEKQKEITKTNEVKEQGVSVSESEKETSTDLLNPILLAIGLLLLILFVYKSIK